MSDPKALPDGPLIAWYGDDFTGAAAVMEVMTFSGLPAVLFLDDPDTELLQRFALYRGLGIAGAARSHSPQWMTDHLPRTFALMAGIGAPIHHYKICSTLDSSPTVGSVGRATELAAPLLGGAWHPLIVGAPQIGRYQLFGNLFARAGEEIHRLDRHPTMSRHPVTPMHEADVGRHLRQQTDIPIGLIDINTITGGGGQTALAAQIADGKVIIALDILDEASLIEAGRLIWTNRGDRLLTIGSQGVEYALAAYWKSLGLIADAPAESLAPVDRMVAISGSCSPVTAEQISRATQNGFTGLRIDPACAVDRRAWEAEIARAESAALSVLGEGSDPILYTALGPSDPATESFRSAVATSGRSAEEVNGAVGSGLGQLMRRLMDKAGLTRGVIAGGDTSSHAAKQLGARALTARALISPGASICAAHLEDSGSEPFEVVLKGGQMGEPDFFGQVRNGGSRRTK